MNEAYVKVHQILRSKGYPLAPALVGQLWQQFSREYADEDCLDPDDYSGDWIYMNLLPYLMDEGV